VFFFLTFLLLQSKRARAKSLKKYETLNFKKKEAVKPFRASLRQKNNNNNDNNNDDARTGRVFYRVSS